MIARGEMSMTIEDEGIYLLFFFHSLNPRSISLLTGNAKHALYCVNTVHPLAKRVQPHPTAARISRSAAARASTVISAPASIRAISSRRRSGSSSAILVAVRLPLARASLVMR